MAQATKVVYGHSSSRICGGAVTSPEVITCACTTGSGEPEVSNFPPKFKFPPIFKLTNGNVSHRKKSTD